MGNLVEFSTHPVKPPIPSQLSLYPQLHNRLSTPSFTFSPRFVQFWSFFFPYWLSSDTSLSHHLWMPSFFFSTIPMNLLGTLYINFFLFTTRMVPLQTRTLQHNSCICSDIPPLFHLSFEYTDSRPSRSKTICYPIRESFWSRCFASILSLVTANVYFVSRHFWHLALCLLGDE